MSNVFYCNRHCFANIAYFSGTSQSSFKKIKHFKWTEKNNCLVFNS
uniref:Macaca fascicularis brain cDNA clone: QtrA-15993, similar to human ATPase, Ca++ transporting, cardiac muscle, slow twitch 2(ATP2A2), transcript variant 2, mRNA, RefSeq: NM_001681.2 n=1 Tax=Macaca fascicularis TaxID=9541 RepID=I7GPG0_MACFA|nr:unnamed protein product [Macaca fascicularis]